METTERLWSVTEAAWACGMTRWGCQKAIDRVHLSPAEMGSTRSGGYRYRESDLRRIFGGRFKPDRSASQQGKCAMCKREGSFENYAATHGLCLDCWCAELNKFLIDRGMTLEDAEKATLESLKQNGVIE